MFLSRSPALRTARPSAPSSSRASSRVSLRARSGALLASALVVAALLDPIAPAFAATAVLTDGKAGAASDLRGLGASGPRDSRWGSQPDPYESNLADHQGRSAGTFEDGGRGRIAGEVLADRDGRATILVRDLKDTSADGRLVVTTGGEATRIAVERGANANTRTISLSGLVAGAWNGFKILWAMGSGGGSRRDGFSVCRG